MALERPVIKAFQCSLYLLLFSLCFSQSAIASEVILKPYHLTFAARYNYIFPFKGKAERALTRLEDGRWLLSNSLSFAVLKIKESSRFKWRRNRFFPQQYDYFLKTPVADKNRAYRFDYNRGEVHSTRGKESARYELTNGLLDRLSFQAALRIDLITGSEVDSYEVAEKHGSKMLKFEVAGEELLQTRLGTFNTIKIMRVRKPGAKRETVFWLAKDWDYLLIKARQKEKNISYEIEIVEGKLAGRPLRGLSADKLDAR